MALQTQFGGKEGVRGFAKATFAAIPDFRWTRDDHTDRWGSRLI
jgi:hypothetical protein